MSPEATTPVAEKPDAGRTPWCFRERWRIRGVLVTESPLHIGSGIIVERADLRDEENDRPARIADCLRDAAGKPVIPATSLRGVLRDWIGQAAVSEQCKRLLGEDSKTEDSGRGGEAEFLDACLTLSRPEKLPLPHWDTDKQTWVEIINSIDREHGAAAESHLAHRETVAAGSGFEVAITGQFSQPKDDIPLLLAALDAFNNPDMPLRLGADTASGQGRMRWELEAVECLDQAAALNWIEASERDLADRAMQSIPSDRLGELQAKAKKICSCRGDLLTLSLRLQFEGPFLVNDPPTEAEKNVEQERKPPDARLRRNEMGQAILPAKSFRGVLRSQGEKILRTLLDLDEETQWQDGDIQRWVERHIACRPEIARLACRPLKDNQEPADHLCLACQTFGAPGWRSPLALDDLALAENPQGYETQTQEMLAVDRFTGGGKDQAKYNAHPIIDPVFEGELRIDLSRLDKRGLGLLALVLSDLQEGWLRFGWGAAGKGYGHCVWASIGGWETKAFRDKATDGWNELITTIDDLQKRLPGGEDGHAPTRKQEAECDE